MGVATLLDLIRQEEAHGRTWGLENTRCLGMFCWLALVGGDSFVKDEDIKAYVRDGVGENPMTTPDTRMELLMDQMRHQQLVDELHP